MSRCLTLLVRDEVSRIAGTAPRAAFSSCAQGAMPSAKHANASSCTQLHGYARTCALVDAQICSQREDRHARNMCCFKLTHACEAVQADRPFRTALC
eukprot:4373502-Pleurochrysis_carterae.AAC.1